MDWFLYDIGLRRERVNRKQLSILKPFLKYLKFSVVTD